MMKFKELLTGKIEEPAMASDSLAKLREMTKYLVVLEGERQTALYDLELERLQLRSLFDSINEPIYVSHPATHKVLYANKAAQEIYGSDIVGENCYEVFHDQDEVCPFCPDEHILGENVGQTYIWEYHSRKHSRWYRCIDRAIYWPDGNGGQLVRFQLAVDITEQKRAEAALREYSEHLEEMVEQRTRELHDARERLACNEKLAALGQLADGASHELRNPLSAIKNAACFLNMVVNGHDPAVKETLEILEREVEISERIINRLLDFARPVPAIRQEVDIDSIIQKALSRIAVPENIEISIQLDEALSIILADPDQLCQVFENIMLNAIQAMPDGGWLKIKVAEESPEWVVISFADTGMGISEEYLGKLFEPLFTTKARGIGLGLAIIRMLIDRHGGDIKVQSELDEGTTFTVRLPLNWKARN